MTRGAYDTTETLRTTPDWRRALIPSDRYLLAPVFIAELERYSNILLDALVQVGDAPDHAFWPGIAYESALQAHRHYRVLLAMEDGR